MQIMRSIGSLNISPRIKPNFESVIKMIQDQIVKIRTTVHSGKPWTMESVKLLEKECMNLHQLLSNICSMSVDAHIYELLETYKDTNPIYIFVGINHASRLAIWLGWKSQPASNLGKFSKLQKTPPRRKAYQRTPSRKHKRQYTPQRIQHKREKTPHPQLQRLSQTPPPQQLQRRSQTPPPPQLRRAQTPPPQQLQRRAQTPPPPQLRRAQTPPPQQLQRRAQTPPPPKQLLQSRAQTPPPPQVRQPIPRHIQTPPPQVRSLQTPQLPNVKKVRKTQPAPLRGGTKTRWAKDDLMYEAFSRGLDPRGMNIIQLCRLIGIDQRGYKIQPESRESILNRINQK